MKQLALINEFGTPYPAHHSIAELMSQHIPFDAVEALLEEHLQIELEDFEMLDIEPATDTSFSAKWKLSSGCQKAIRRNYLNDAVRCAVGYYRIDAASFWARLPIIALEDIGVGDALTVALVLAAARSSVLRKKAGGDEKMIHFLVKRMAESVKDRTVADQFQILDNRSLPPEALALLKSATPQKLSIIALSDQHPYELRIASLWMLWGDRMKNSRLPLCTGSLEWFNRTVEDINVPSLVHYITQRSMIASRGCAMNISYAYVWEMLQKSPYRRLIETALPEPFYIGGVVEQSWDKHTRYGKLAYQDFYKTCPAVNEFLTSRGIVGNDAVVAAIGTAIFIHESALLDKRIDFEGAEQIYHLTEEDDYRNNGLTLEEGRELSRLIQENTDILRRSRQRVVEGQKN